MFFNMKISFFIIKYTRGKNFKCKHKANIQHKSMIMPYKSNIIRYNN